MQFLAYHHCSQTPKEAVFSSAGGAHNSNQLFLSNSAWQSHCENKADISHNIYNTPTSGITIIKSKLFYSKENQFRAQRLFWLKSLNIGDTIKFTQVLQGFVGLREKEGLSDSKCGLELDIFQR